MGVRNLFRYSHRPDLHCAIKYRICLLHKIFLCLFVAFTTLIAHSQNSALRQFTIEDGLPSNTVYHIIQDRQGYIWFATGIGVSRFDGNEFVNFELKDGLTDLDVLKLFEDSHGRIWFLFLNGTVCYYENGKIINEKINPKLRELRIESGIATVTEDSEGTIFFGGITGNIISYSGEQTTLNYVFSPSLNFCLRAAGNDVYILSQKGNYLLKNNGITPIDSEFRPQGSNDVYFDETNRTSYFLTPRGMASFCDGKFRLEDPMSPNDVQFEMVQSILVDKNQHYWINTQTRGVWKFTRSSAGFEKEVFFEKSFVNFSFCDKEGSIWFSTAGDGIYQMRSQPTYVNGIELNTGSTKQPIISALALSEEGELWTGTVSGELFKIKDGHIENHNWENPNYKNLITSIWCTSSGTYVGDVLRTRFITKGTGASKLLKQHLDSGIDADAMQLKGISSFGDEIYGVSYGAFKLEADGVFHRFEFPAIKGERINTLHIDKDGTMWYNHANLLNAHKHGRTVAFEHLRPEFNGKITGIGRLANGEMVIATYGSGIKFMQNNRIVGKVDASDGLASNICRSLFIDGDTMYVATNKGFSIVKYLNGRYDVESFSVKDRLPAMDIKCIVADDSSIYVGTAIGLYKVNKQIHTVATSAPLVVVQHVIVDKQQVDLQDVDISSNFLSLVIQYSVITFISPHEVQYAYRFSPQDPWIETQQISLEFSRLSPGRYHLQLRARKFDSDWGATTIIDFNVVPQWWQTSWFKFIVIAFIFFVSIFLARRQQQFRHNRDLQEWRKQEAVDEERMRIAEDMHDDIGADLSNLLLVARMGKRDAAEGEDVILNYSQIESITSESLQKIDEIIWSLNAQNDSLEELLVFTEKYFYEFIGNAGLDGAIKIRNEYSDRFLPASTRRSVFLIVKEAINNVVKHAKATTVALLIEIEPDRMLIKLSDDGIGMQLNAKERNGNGMKNMSSRVEKLGGRMTIAPNSGWGTTIDIILPLT